jgi:hypothetical protein
MSLMTRPHREVVRHPGEPRVSASAGRLLCVVVVAAAAAMAVACGGIERRIGASAARTVEHTGAQFRSGPGRDSLIASTDSIASYLASAVTRRVLPVIDTVETQLLASVQSALYEVRDSLTGAVTVHWTPAIQGLIAGSVGAAGQQGQYELAALLRTLQAESQTQLLPLIHLAVGNATAAALDGVAARLGPHFQAGLLALADSVARVGARAAVGQTTPIWKNLQWLLVLAGMIVFALLALWFHLQRRRVERDRDRSVAALAATTDAIHEVGARDVAQAVQRRARQRDVEPWLREFLRERGALVSAPETEGEPVAHGN